MNSISGYFHAEDAAFSSSTSDKLNISIVTDSPLFGNGLVSLLYKDLNLDQINLYVPTYNDTNLVAQSSSNNIVLIDSNLGRTETLTEVGYWQGVRGALPVVIELANDIRFIVECIEAGALGYMMRSDTYNHLVHTIRRTQCKMPDWSPEVMFYLSQRLTSLSNVIQISDTCTPNLTQRERETLASVAKGYSNKNIAGAMVIEVRTVKHHIHNILRKLQVNGREDAVRVAYNTGLLPIR